MVHQHHAPIFQHTHTSQQLSARLRLLRRWPIFTLWVLVLLHPARAAPTVARVLPSRLKLGTYLHAGSITKRDLFNPLTNATGFQALPFPDIRMQNCVGHYVAVATRHDQKGKVGSSETAT